ncbi:benzoyl-CoA 2,3-epoxidase subunit BoxA [Hydrogenophaga pseudoflava]|uniref:benzoyl-CoA 2,3-epoxidase subunit BoxA n=1 Tax=Hydrogenophaga pseudoflava TaxID=47421 RepID=UPI0027E3EB1C|nr:benzoyl-CoA 2,3-epoxidase subunit BoxA [Hydrogenophaga pseudoflava]MDQ7746779.1 benzoyl-CoA 2,3-epoxidase subunit BoxA [Hydrogenophaga pseudoflava]
MNAPLEAAVIKQHLIDPEICIRCNTCESICPVGAITHDSRNYVVDVSKCNWCNDCISPCPTGSIDNYRRVVRARAYSLEEQLGWDVLPAELSSADLAAAAADAGEPVAQAVTEPEPAPATDPTGQTAFNSAQYGASIPPWSAAHAYANLYGPKAAQKTVTATVTGNLRVTAVGKDYDTHHIVLDFGSMPFPVLEGQSIGIVPPGLDAQGRPHHARQYSIASPRNGERPGHNNLSLTIKRVLEDHSGQPVRGVASNYMCDLQVGDQVQVIGPFGTSFLMPNHPKSSIVMICTGTGSAPMRAMTEWRRRLRASGKFESGKLMLFFGARTQEELPYFGPLQSLPKDFIDSNFAFSRTPGQPKRYVQDAMRERAADLATLLQDPNACFYVCGLKAMEEGVVLALRDIATGAGLDWDEVGAALKREGRLHLETY